MFEKLKQQMDFLYEVDKLKSIYRESRLINDPRHENDSEHSWHVALMAFILAEHSDEKIDVLKVVKMLLIHDIVEIDAGDVFLYDEKANEEKPEKEQAAAKRIFGLLPSQQRDEMISLWEEFETRESPEAKFATIIDRLEPSALNYKTDGYTWKTHDVPLSLVNKSLNKTHFGSEAIWQYIKGIIDNSVEQGHIRKD